MHKTYNFFATFKVLFITFWNWKALVSIHFYCMQHHFQFWVNYSFKHIYPTGKWSLPSGADFLRVNLKYDSWIDRLREMTLQHPKHTQLDCIQYNTTQHNGKHILHDHLQILVNTSEWVSCDKLRQGSPFSTNKKVPNVFICDIVIICIT